MKTLLMAFAVATILTLSGCASMKTAPGDIVIKAVPERSTDLLIGRTQNVGLSENDRIKISDTIKHLLVDQASPVILVSEKGESITLEFGDFNIKSEGYYSISIKVTVGEKIFLPPTTFNLTDGEWMVANGAPVEPRDYLSEEEFSERPVPSSSASPASSSDDDKIPDIVIVNTADKAPKSDVAKAKREVSRIVKAKAEASVVTPTVRKVEAPRASGFTELR